MGDLFFPLRKESLGGGISYISVHKLKDHYTIEMKINIAITMSTYSIVIIQEKGLQVKMGKI